ncbi:hypothetical protein [Parvibaculum sp.]|uniref:hypothetical protein n=1 Tax=Parvibaculum sp. TaxID=2024848 RepID=UPI001DC2064C|nr:hypothetical protein [Parvibaculum sp.]MBX3490873.1 hypothetical protein [Parvibaculum sp.]
MKLPAEVITGQVSIAIEGGEAKSVLAFMLGDLAVTPVRAETSCETGVLWSITHVPSGFGLAAGAALFRRAEDAVGAMYDIHTLFGRPHEIPIQMFAPAQMRIVEICLKRRGVLPGQMAA